MKNAFQKLGIDSGSGFPRIRSAILGPHDKDYSIIGSILALQQKNASRAFFSSTHEFRV